MSVRTRGCWSGFGHDQVGSKSTNSPWYSAWSLDQMASMAARCSRTTTRRRPKSTPWSSASALFHPKPTPSVTRPPERWSRVATCLASTMGSCWAASRMPVPSPIRSVDGGGRGQRDERVEAALVVVEAYALDQRRRRVLADREVGVLGQPERVEADLLDGHGQRRRRDVEVGQCGGDAKAHGQERAWLGGELGQRAAAAAAPSRWPNAACSRRLA